MCTGQGALLYNSTPVQSVKAFFGGGQVGERERSIFSEFIRNLLLG